MGAPRRRWRSASRVTASRCSVRPGGPVPIGAPTWRLRGLTVLLPPSRGRSKYPAAISAWRASPRAICSSPLRPGRGRRRAASYPPIVPVSGRGDCRLDQRNGLAERGLSACHGALEFGSAALEALELIALLVIGEEGIAQRIAGDRLELRVAQPVIARRAKVFVGEIDARDARIIR